MISLTVENYVKAIFMIVSEQDGRPAATGQLAATLAVSPGTVTSMLKTLSESELATYTPYEGASLTTAGKALALRMIRRHRLIELFLVKTLNLSWADVHEEAEHMEHAMSDLLIDRIDAYLGYPQVDPHGDPIPRADGSLTQSDTQLLSECPPEREFRLARVVDQSADFLTYLTEAGLNLGTTGKVTANRPAAGIIVIRVGNRELTLGHEAARKILVTPLSAGN